MNPAAVFALGVELFQRVHDVTSVIEHARAPFPVKVTIDASPALIGPCRIVVAMSPDKDPVVDFSRGGVAVKI